MFERELYLIHLKIGKEVAPVGENYDRGAAGQETVYQYRRTRDNLYRWLRRQGLRDQIQFDRLPDSTSTVGFLGVMHARCSEDIAKIIKERSPHIELIGPGDKKFYL